MIGLHAFAFQTGSWRVRHRRLRERLTGSTDWFEFDGACRAWELLDGAANVEEHRLDDPNGAYLAATFRKLDPATGEWSIWWADSRFPGLDPPVRGRFEGGIGTFFGSDSLRGEAIDVRFIWSGVTDRAARWEQAFSRAGSGQWETNWIMEFERIAA